MYVMHHFNTHEFFIIKHDIYIIKNSFGPWNQEKRQTIKHIVLLNWYGLYVLKCNLCLSVLPRLKSHRAHRIMKSLRSSTPWGKGIISERRPSSGAVLLQSPAQFSFPHFNPVSITFWYMGTFSIAAVTESRNFVLSTCILVNRILQTYS